MRSFALFLALMSCGCGAAHELPPPLPELKSPIPGPPPLPTRPEFNSVELVTLDAAGQPVQTIEEQSEFEAKLTFDLKQGSIPVNRVLIRLVQPSTDGDLIYWEGFEDVEKDSSGALVVATKIKAPEASGNFDVVAFAGDYEFARTSFGMREKGS